MAQPPQFRPGGPGGPQGAMPPGQPGGPGAPGMPPGQGQPPSARQSMFQAQPYPVQPPAEVEKKKKGKKGKKKTSIEDSDDDDDEDACKCPPQQPSTQIFICPPSCQPGMAGMGMGMGAPPGMSGQDGGLGLPTSQQNPYQIDAAKLCQIQCYGGGKSQDEDRTQVICCPPSVCRGCQKKQQKPRNQGGMCQCCGQECPLKKSKKPQAGTMEGMMPASQQFLMFLQAYGLAAALIRDRNRREDERQQKEFEEKQKRGSQSKDRKGSAKGKDRKGSGKAKGKDKK